MNVYELYGHLAEEHANLTEFYKKTLALLGDLSNGKVDVSRLRVFPNGWDVTPESIEQAGKDDAS